MATIKAGQTYRFSFRAPQILGTGYDNAYVLSVCSFEEAQRVIDVKTLHLSALPSLPEGTIRDPSALEYVKIKTSAGLITAFAVEWLSHDPDLLSSGTIVATITGTGLGQRDLPRIRQALIEAGYTSLEVTMKGI